MYCPECKSESFARWNTENPNIFSCPNFSCHKVFKVEEIPQVNISLSVNPYGGMIPAIKALREQTGMSLINAKQTIEFIRACLRDEEITVTSRKSTFGELKR